LRLGKCTCGAWKGLGVRIMEPGTRAVKIPASEKQPKSAAHSPRTELGSLAQVQETHPPQRIFIRGNESLFIRATATMLDFAARESCDGRCPT
jgi:hypothetical protein